VAGYFNKLSLFNYNRVVLLFEHNHY